MYVADSWCVAARAAEVWRAPPGRTLLERPDLPARRLVGEFLDKTKGEPRWSD